MKRNDGLDLLKFICCFMVICLHTPFPRPISNITIPLSRMAVPIFFMITGYFYSNTNHKKQLFKITKIFFSSNALYFLYISGINIIKRVPLTSFLNFNNIIKFVIFNESPFSGHLWYIGAILYVLIIIFIFEKYYNREKLYFLIPVLLLGDLVLGKYSLLFLGKEIPYIFIRNFLFVGLPYFLIGDIMFKKKINIKQKYLWMLIILFAGTTLLERYLLDMFNMNATRDHYFSTTFLAFFCFLLACNYTNKYSAKMYKNICFIGSKLSLDIYILHPITILVLEIIVRIIQSPNFSILYSYISPFAVFIATIIISKFKIQIVEKLRLYKNNFSSLSN